MLTLAGIVLITVGAVLVLISLPAWLWLTLLGLLLILIGIVTGRGVGR